MPVTIYTTAAGNFLSTATWQGGLVPGAGYRAQIDHDVTLDQSILLGDTPGAVALTVSASGSLLITGTCVLRLIGNLLAEGPVDVTGSADIVEGVQYIQGSPRGGFRIELRNLSDALTYAFSQVTSCRWEYARNGGCDVCQATVVSPWGTVNTETIQHYDLQVMVRVAGGSMANWWKGEVLDAEYIDGDVAQLQLKASGWWHFLEKQPVVGLGFPLEAGGVVFEDQDSAAIVRSLIDRVAKPGTAYSYDGDTIPDSGFAVERIEFNGSTADAIRVLAEMSGRCEFGVDRLLQVHFRPKSSILRHQLRRRWVGQGMRLGHTSQQEINRVYVAGADDFYTVVEDSSDLVVSQSATDEAGFDNFGMATTYQMSLQEFTPLYPTLGQVEVKLSKVGFSGLVSDGDMESGTVSSWTAFSETTLAKSTTNPHGGSQCLRIYSSGGLRRRIGFYQDVTVTAGVNINFSVWVKAPTGSGTDTQVQIELVNGSGVWGGAGAILQSASVKTTSWTRVSLPVATTGGNTTLGIRIYVRRVLGGDPFFVDDMEAAVGGADLELAVVKRTAVTPTAYDEELATSQISFSAVSTYPLFSTHQIGIYPPKLDTSAVYGIRLKTTGDLSDSSYFRVRTGPLAGDNLLYYNGTVWAASLATMYYQISLTTAARDRNLRALVVSHPNLMDEADSVLYGESILAEQGSPQSRAFVPIRPGWDRLVEATMPIGTFSVLGRITTPMRMERVVYRKVDEGLDMAVDLGKIYPRLADIQEWFRYRLDLAGQ